MGLFSQSVLSRGESATKHKAYKKQPVPFTMSRSQLKLSRIDSKTVIHFNISQSKNFGSVGQFKQSLAIYQHN